MARTADEALIGRTVAGKYVIEAFIGGGAMGAVYKAKQLSLDKAVAIKVLHADLSDATFIARFQREAKAASKLDHPNSMRVLDYGRDTDGMCYIAMEFLDGQSLFRILREIHGPVPEPRTVDLTRQILAALAAAHDMGIVHRDLKPENIIVVESRGDEGNVTETVKVCDFGMAKMMATEASADSSIEKLTSRGIVVGTPEYMSPEQGKGEELDARSDLYSAGVILYQMLTGKLPFEAETPIATLLKHLVEPPRPPSALFPDVHPELEAICLRALSKDKEDRFGSAREMRAALRAALDASSPAALDAGASSDPRQVDDEPPLSLPYSSVKQPASRSPYYSSPELLPPQEVGPATPAPRRRAVEMVEARAPRRRAPYGALLAVFVVLAAGAGFVAWKRTTPALPSVVEAPPTSAPVAPDPPVAHEDPPASAKPVPAPPASVASAPPADVKPVGSAAASRSGKKGEATATVPAPPASHAASPQAPGPSPAPPGPPEVAPAGPVAPAGTGAFDKASVALGSVRTTQAQSSDVTAALPSGRFNQCYRDGLRARGSMKGSGVLHLVFGSDGHVTETSFAGPPDLAAVGQCVSGAAIGTNIKNVATAGSGAEVDLSFKPD